MLCPVIVGRDDELTALAGAVEAAASGAGSVQFLVGEAGVGKSRLARACAEIARSRGMLACSGRAVPSGVPVAYRALAEAFLSALRGAEGAAVLDDPSVVPFRSSLGWLVPEWHRPGEPVPGSPLLASEGTLRLVGSLARGSGCVLVLEDLHWADAETLAHLQYVADNVGAERVLVVATLRSEGASPALALAHSLRARGSASVQELPALPGDEVLRMAAACLGTEEPPAEVARLLGAHADGLPFLVEELLASLVATGGLVRDTGGWRARPVLAPVVPVTVVDSVRQRLDALDEPVRRVLVAGAVLGRRFDSDLLPAMTGLERHAVLAALRLGVDAQLLDQDGADTDRFRFRHALTRDALLNRLLRVERTGLAQRALLALEEHVASGRSAEPAVPPELAADLAEQAGEHCRAARLLVTSARGALAGGALATAAAGAARARELAEGDPVTAAEADELQVEAAALAGDTDRAARVGARLLDELARLGAAPSRRAAAHVGLARAAVSAADWARARAHVESARRLADPADEPVVSARLDVLASTIALGGYDVDGAARWAERALAAAEDHAGPELVCEALELLGRCTRLRDLGRAESCFDRALAVARDAGLVLWRARALHELSTIDMARLGPVDRAVAARAAAEQVGALGLVAQIDLHLTIMHAEAFRLDAALAAAERADRAARRFGLSLVSAGVVITLTGVRVMAGDPGAAAVLAARACEVAAGVPEFEASALGLGLGFLHLAGEDRARARSELAEAVALVPEDSDIGRSELWGIYLLAHLGHERRDPPGPARVNRVNAGCLALSDAVALGARGDADGARAAFDRGDALLAPAPFHRQLGRRLVAEHAVADAWGAPVEWLREAAAFFTAGGHDALVTACRSLLRKAGAPVGRRGRGAHPVPGELAGLGVTSRELDVLALLADGLTNRDIGARLYLSPRTVEKHVERLLAKTGSVSRAQLAALAARASR